MEEKKVMELLRYYRHDIMNDLQVVHAYAKLEKVDKVQEKIAGYMIHFDEERKLMSLHAPNLALWLIPFNSIHPNFRLTYTIRSEGLDISDLDQKFVGDCLFCIEWLEKITDEKELYEGVFVFEYLPHIEQIQIQISLYGSIIEPNLTLPIGKENITQRFDDNQITCIITNPWNGKGEK